MSQKMDGYIVKNGNAATTDYVSENDCCITNSFPSINYYASHKGCTGSHISYKSTKNMDCAFNSYTYDDVETTANFLLEKTKYRPVIGIICGSGLGSLAESLKDKECFPYDTVPNFPASTVEGHIGQLVFGLLGDVHVICMQGRLHYYEGYPISKCAMPIRVMKMIGVNYLITTNAAGGLNEKYEVGDIMIIKDHVNFMGFAGVNPLRGPNDERFGPRFPAVSKAYDPKLRATAMRIGQEMGIGHRIQEGIYTCVGGPNFETVAELTALKILGIDAVGMSTIYEVIVACHSDMTVFAFSLITNKCMKTSDEEAVPNHEEVIQAGKDNTEVLRTFVTRIVQHITQTS